MVYFEVLILHSPGKTEENYESFMQYSWYVPEVLTGFCLNTSLKHHCYTSLVSENLLSEKDCVLRICVT